MRAAALGGEMADEWLPRALASVENASHVREAYYRDKVARLREMAETEPLGRFRKQLIDLAEQYGVLADTARRREN